MRLTDAACRKEAQTGRVLVMIRIEDGARRPAGEVVEAGGRSRRFEGWLGLLAILGDILEPQPPAEVPRRAGGQLDPRAQVDPGEDV